jgi:Rrf2 family protein
VHITAKSDYAVRAVLSLARHESDPVTDPEAGPVEEPVVKIGVICEEQGLPRKFLEGILGDLRRAGIVRTRRGGNGGYGLARPADEITLGSVLRAVDGPLAEVRGLRPHETSYSGAAEHLPEVWVAVRHALREVLDETTVAQVLSGKLPPAVAAMVTADDAWAPR